jgi:hypothetical protein
MRDSLKKLLFKENTPINLPGRTLNALRARRLVDKNNKLTETGTIVGLKTVSLKKQCEIIGIQIETLKLKREYADPSVNALFYFMKQGNRGSYCEGVAIRKVLFCLYAHRLIKIPIKKGNNDFFDGLSTYPFAVGLDMLLNTDGVQDYDSLTEELLSAINECNRDIFLTNYRELFPKGLCWYGVDELFAVQLFDLLGIEELKNLARIIFSEPSAFYVGWPDLTLIRDGSVELLEVKTTDKLHESQLITIPAIIENCNINVKILKL